MSDTASDLTGLGIKPQTFRTESYVLNHVVNIVSISSHPPGSTDSEGFLKYKYDIYFN